MHLHKFHEKEQYKSIHNKYFIQKWSATFVHVAAVEKMYEDYTSVYLIIHLFNKWTLYLPLFAISLCFTDSESVIFHLKLFKFGH